MDKYDPNVFPVAQMVEARGGTSIPRQLRSDPPNLPIMKARSFSWSGYLVAVFLNVAVTRSAWMAQAIEPQLEQCTLQVGGQVLKPTEVRNSWRMTHHVGTNRFIVSDDTVE